MLRAFEAHEETGNLRRPTHDSPLAPDGVAEQQSAHGQDAYARGPHDRKGRSRAASDGCH
jgi:hypothetical protein